jgi:hopene-associated glycosyltransferase HpnB
MVLLVIEAAGAISVAIWMYLLLARGGFWRLSAPGPSVPSQGPPGPACPAIVAIIPARDEAEVIARSVTSLLAQSEIECIHVFVVDDGSGDGTASVAMAAAKNAGKAGVLTVISGQTLPPGWSGKLWALQQGIVCASKLTPRYVLLTDADVAHAPGELSALRARMEAGGYDLASLMVRLRCESFAEKLLIPAFVFFFFQLYPPRWVANSRRATAGAAGGCILLRPEALERAGGLAAIRGQVIDDCVLARAVKNAGGRIWLGPAEETASIRAAGGFAEIGQMIARTAFSQLRHSTVLLLLTVFAMALIYLLPVGLVVAGRPLLVTLGAVAWLLMAVAYWPTVKYYGLPPLSALSLPASALFFTGATIHSAMQYWRGRGGEWKGRVQDSNK